MFHAQQDLHTGISSELVGDADGKRAGAVALIGYLRPGTSPDRIRLYRDQDGELYIEFFVKDIVDRSSATGTAEQSMVWVRRDATLARVESMHVAMFDKPMVAEVELEEIRRWPLP
jgi:hypothetical protein